MDSGPTFPPPTASKHEKTLVASSEIVKILGCDLTEATEIWEEVKMCLTENEVQRRLETIEILQSRTITSTILQVYQLALSHQKTCMTFF
ncbi:hypothetical protein GCK72_009712 [Caenorhabditis remanei]|uniref:Uncharacterized protein n=1 Tax=Caenorhabditis remanei TaxID=31234 RepID=A0A6A5H3N6_CAERE|nr:hypothetical protein GCK72_009712 [Caenorhabditis remanei]KAF1761456.1 hypothetical protein GCK72_009712 [Caenorhabditis remanei]